MKSNWENPKVKLRLGDGERVKINLDDTSTDNAGESVTVLLPNGFRIAIYSSGDFNVSKRGKMDAAWGCFKDEYMVRFGE